jgi:NhaP-type Na+/H+ or K+/H+ antiporter
MTQTVETLFAIGGILLLGLATDYLGRRTVLPRVTLLMLFGILIGDEALALIPATLSSRFELIAATVDFVVCRFGYDLDSYPGSGNCWRRS